MSAGRRYIAEVLGDRSVFISALDSDLDLREVVGVDEWGGEGDDIDLGVLDIHPTYGWIVIATASGLWRYSLDEGSLTKIVDLWRHAGPALEMKMSPDGQRTIVRLMECGAEDNALLLDDTGMALANYYDDGASLDPEWSATGGLLRLSNYVVDVVSGDILYALPLDRSFSSIRFHPSDDYMMLRSFDRGGELSEIVDIQSGSHLGTFSGTCHLSPEARQVVCLELPKSSIPLYELSRVALGLGALLALWLSLGANRLNERDPTQSFRQNSGNVARVIVAALLVWLLLLLFAPDRGPILTDASHSWPLVALATVITLFGIGGFDWIAHYSLRLAMVLEGQAPWRYTRFLSYAVDRALLRKVGGGYIFVHRVLAEHFAGQTGERTDDDSHGSP